MFWYIFLWANVNIFIYSKDIYIFSWTCSFISLITFSIELLVFCLSTFRYCLFSKIFLLKYSQFIIIAAKRFSFIYMYTFLILFHYNYYKILNIVPFSVQTSHSVVSDSLWPHELQHTRQASLSITNSQNSLKLMSIESVILAYFLKGLLPGTQGDI